MGFGSIVGALAGPVVGGLFSAMGQRDANQANRKLAKKQQQFQERMSNTAVQRRMADLDAAGINPILAGRYDASTPPGQMATMGSELGAGVQGAHTAAQMKVMAEQIKNIMQDTSLKKSQSEYVQSQDALAQAQTNSEILRALGITTANQIAELDRQVKALGIPSVKAESDLWKWLAQADLDEQLKALGKAAPLVAQVIRLFIVRGVNK